MEQLRFPSAQANVATIALPSKCCKLYRPFGGWVKILLHDLDWIIPWASFELFKNQLSSVQLGQVVINGRSSVSNLKIILILCPLLKVCQLATKGHLIGTGWRSMNCSKLQLPLRMGRVNQLGYHSLLIQCPDTVLQSPVQS